MAPRTDFPPVRACIFDMDGLLLDTEDSYTECINRVLARYGRPNLPWSVKAKLQGRPAVEANKLFLDLFQLPISQDEYVAQVAAHQRELFPRSAPLPGVEKLLADLQATSVYSSSNTSTSSTTTFTTANIHSGGDMRDIFAAPAPPDTTTAIPHKVHLALATSSTKTNLHLKTDHLPPHLMGVFAPQHRVTGDDARVPAGRGKPLPDIYQVALQTLNDSLAADGNSSEPPIAPEECLVLEDSVPGVEAGRRAGMRVVWCPHPLLEREFRGRHAEVLAGLTGAAGVDVDAHTLGEVGDGWGEYVPTLEDFPYDKYGIVLAPADRLPAAAAAAAPGLDVSGGASEETTKAAAV